MVLRSLLRGSGFAASLFAHIQKILSLGANKEMFWANAQRCVAAVTDAHAIWDWAVSQLPSRTMGQETFALASIRRDAVSVGSRGAMPHPTGRGFLYVGPEANGEGLSFHVRHITT